MSPMMRSVTRAPTGDSYDRNGFKMIRKRYGAIKENGGVLGIGLRNFVPQEMASTVGASLLRHLLKKHYKLDVAHPNQEVFAHQWAFNNLDPAANRWESAALVPPNTWFENQMNASYTIDGLGSDGVNQPAPVYAVAFYVEKLVTTDLSKPLASGYEGNKYTVFIPGTVGTQDYAVFRFTRDTTLQSFGEWWAWIVCNGGFGSCEDKNLAIKGYQFFHLDVWKTNTTFDGSTSSSTKALIRPQGMNSLEKMYIKCSSRCTIRFQNRTKSDSNSESIDQNSTNPLKVTLYHHGTTIPIQKDPRQMATISNNADLYVIEDSNYLLFNTDRDDGLIVTGGGTLEPEWQVIGDAHETDMNNSTNSTVGAAAGFHGTLSPYIHTPPAFVFDKVTHTGRDVIGPGHIKSFSVRFRFDGLLKNFIHGLGEQAVGTLTYPNTTHRFKTPLSKVKDHLGTCDMLWFEEVMPSWNYHATSNPDHFMDISFDFSRSNWAKVKKTIPVCMPPHQAHDVTIGD